MIKTTSKSYKPGYFQAFPNWDISEATFDYDGEDWILISVEQIILEHKNGGWKFLNENTIEALCDDDAFRLPLQEDVAETWTP